MSQYLLKFLLGLLSFVIFLVVAFFVKKYINIFITKLPASKQKAPLFISKILHFAIIGLGILSLLGSIGIDLKNLIAGLGLTGFIIGFALKDIISAIASGIIIIINDNITIGDIITYKEIEGKVLKIELRHIVLQEKSSNKKHFISTNKLLSEHFSVEKKDSNKKTTKAIKNSTKN